jgi:oligoribonuclease NrnB/cAMP/cGMP phosphodiesterase (DHH superfamily)
MSDASMCTAASPCLYMACTTALTRQHVSRSVTVLDHHKTAFEMFERPAEGNVAFDIGNCSVHLDMDRSGATMALDHWKPGGLTDMQQQLFLYVEDGDLWRWKLPQSKEFYAGVLPAVFLMGSSLVQA